jgi:hypothetical protein
VEDFPPNSHKARITPISAKVEPKHVEKVVEQEVTRRKKPLGKRLFETFLGGDARSTTSYLVMEVLIPAAKDTITDLINQGAERMLYGESRSRNRRSSFGSSSTGYVSYNRYSASAAPARREEPRQQMSRRGRAYHDLDEIVLGSRVEAGEVLDRLEDLIGRYESASVGDLYDLVGEPKTHVDERWGWKDLRGAKVVKLRDEGFVLDLPRPETLD